MGTCTRCGATAGPPDRFCGYCGSALPADGTTAGRQVRSGVGGSDADLDALLRSGGQVIPCPACDDLNGRTARYCRSCGHPFRHDTPDGDDGSRAAAERPPGGAADTSHLAGAALERKSLALSIFALAVFVGATGVVYMHYFKPRPVAPTTALAIAAPAPIILQPGPAASHAQPVSSRSTDAPPATSAPLAGHKPAPPANSSEVRIVRPPPRRSAPSASSHAAHTAQRGPVDEIYESRSAAECERGLAGLLCRERIRLSLCEGRWSDKELPGASICRVPLRQTSAY